MAIRKSKPAFVAVIVWNGQNTLRRALRDADGDIMYTFELLPGTFYAAGEAHLQSLRKQIGAGLLLVARLDDLDELAIEDVVYSEPAAPVPAGSDVGGRFGGIDRDAPKFTTFPDRRGEKDDPDA